MHKLIKETINLIFFSSFPHLHHASKPRQNSLPKKVKISTTKKKKQGKITLHITVKQIDSSIIMLSNLVPYFLYE